MLSAEEAANLMLLAFYCALDVTFRNGLAEVPELPA
jgi:hypothetical protein